MSSDNKQTAVNTSYISLIGNFVLAVGKGLPGVLGNSYALISDAIESTTVVVFYFFFLSLLLFTNKLVAAQTYFIIRDAKT